MSEQNREMIAKRLREIDEVLLEIQNRNRTLGPHAQNLLQYIAASAMSDATLQQLLAKEGFSSLGRSQPHIRHTILKILGHLGEARPSMAPLSFDEARKLKEANATMFGPKAHHPHVMITLSGEAADDPHIIPQLSEAGVRLFRINTAHDTPDTWKKMAETIDKERRRSGRLLKIHVDLAGPKIRTGEIKGEKIRVNVGDRIKLLKKEIVGEKLKKDHYTAKISCTSKEVFDYVRVGDPIFIDDGKISGLVVEKNDSEMLFEVLSRAAKGGNIKAHKGINFPKSRLDLPALTEEDRKNLHHVAPFADLIGLSFTQKAKDISDLTEALHDLSCNAAIVPKIETASGVDNLPEILLALIAAPHQSAIMIARGDLAIETGFENLPFIQQEIIDLCNAATLPVIYATQVLESKMKTNIPSRAEAIDAAYANRTDCIMLNKGPFANEAVGTLLQIFDRYKNLYERNRHLLRVPKAWEDAVKDYL